MVLAVDIGNTTVTLGVMKNTKTLKTYCVLATCHLLKYKNQLRRVLKKIKKQFGSFDKIIICSVVPQNLKISEQTICDIFKIQPLVIGRDIRVPIKNRYRNPSQVGQDRLVCAYAAKVLYGAPCIVVDFGTAITFDVVSKKGEYLGGAIVPGLRLSLESLFEKTALLPKVKLTKPRELIGRDTENSILSGIFYGFARLCTGMVELLTEEVSEKFQIVLTGGNLKIMKPYLKKAYIFKEDLLLQGLSLILTELKELRR